MKPIDKRFLDDLALYGAGLEQWPEEARLHALAVHDPEAVMARIIEEQLVEDVLHNWRLAPPPGEDFAARIARAAVPMHKKPTAHFMASLREALELLVPRPATAFAGVLVAGCLIGMVLPDTLPPTGGESALHFYSDDNGAIL